MAVRLTGWLEDTFATQLLLGNSWLLEKNKQKKSGATPGSAQAWSGLYHDNGSCLDITNDIHPERNSYLQILQLSPIVLTDGQTQIHAHFSPECLPHLYARPSSLTLHAVIAVRRYTIRYTSYGPPRDKLRFILQAFDCLGQISEAVHQQDSDELTPPWWSEEVLAILRQLHITRASEDRRCLTSSFGTDEETDETPAVMGSTEDASQGASQPHTQFAFGTQVAHPLPRRPSNDEPQVLGVNRLEPVLAGNTQREELRPKVTSATLLSLLHRANIPSIDKSINAPVDRFVRATLDKPQRAADSAGTQPFTQLPILANRQPTQTQDLDKDPVVSSPQPARLTKQAREVEVISHGAEEDLQEQLDNATTAQESNSNRLQRLASECSWMSGFEFSREALKVSYNQLSILQKEESWHKPKPGYRFPDGNVPIGILTTLHRLADENAAMEAGPDSDDGMDEDPSPDSPIETVDLSPPTALQATPDVHLSSSQVSWSASPSPEPPKVQSRMNQGLPPDSSFEVVEATVDHVTRVTAALSQPQQPIAIESSHETEQAAPPSSPPVAEEPQVFDDDMEMEEYVPQGLGEDGVEEAREEHERHSLSVSPSTPVVQVKETPYVKGKNAQYSKHSSSSPPQPQESSGTPKNTSTSIVHGTYDDKTSSKLANNPLYRDTSVVTAIGTGECKGAQLDEGRYEETHESANQIANDTGPGVTVQNTTAPEALVVSLQQQEHAQPDGQSTRHATKGNHEPQSLPEPTMASGLMSSRVQGSPKALVPPKDEALSIIQQPLEKAFLSKDSSLMPVPAKRKLDESPPKKSSRQSKRREIKVVGFGDISPNSADYASALRHYREESLRKFREARKSSSTLRSRTVSAEEPRFQRDGDAMELDSPTIPPSDVPAPAMSPRHVSLYEESGPSKPAPVLVPALQSPSVSSQITQPVAIPEPVHIELHARSGEESPAFKANSNSRETTTIFGLFKEAYPEYTGDVKHFQGQCIQMITLDQEDKMVPKWQWDDYLIRNRTDYKNYALDCVDRGDNPEPYHRFYKDTIRDTIYRKGIIEDKGTVLKALQQLNVEPRVTKSNESSTRSSHKTKRSRVSLPSAFQQPEASLKTRLSGTTRQQPRYSLPARSQHSHQTPVKNLDITKIRTPTPSTSRDATPIDRSTPRPNPLTRLSLDSAGSSRVSVNGDATASASDPFRDAVFAYQRMTLLTGSTKVDSRLPWPRNLAVRPSIADAPKRKINVLRWRDEL